MNLILSWVDSFYKLFIYGLIQTVSIRLHILIMMDTLVVEEDIMSVKKAIRGILRETKSMKKNLKHHHSHHHNNHFNIHHHQKLALHQWLIITPRFVFPLFTKLFVFRFWCIWFLLNIFQSLREQSKEESKKKCGIMVGKSVSQHFHLYMVRKSNGLKRNQTTVKHQ